jgi:hypothetical protein
MCIALVLSLSHSFLHAGFLFGGDVLEEFLDQVDVSEDHAAAAVALETDGVECVTGRRQCQYELRCRSEWLSCCRA